MSFKSDVKRWTNKAKRIENAIARDVALTVTEALVDGLPEYADVNGSPVDTGFFRANWRVGLNAMPPMGAEGVAADNSAVVALGKAGDVFYIVNGVEYGPYLELGRSPQAPSGIVGPTAAAFRGTVDGVTEKP